jgi:surface antigen
MTPVETFAGEQGQPCREFTMRGFVDGESEEVFGTACRQPDGTWRIVESAPV